MIFSKKSSFILQVYFFLFLIQPNFVEASNFHVILVADLRASRIEEGVKKDLEGIQKEMETIAKHTGLLMQKKLFTGKKTDPEEMITYFRDLQVDADDVILFYFSGHGFRNDRTQDNDWPILAFEKAGIAIQFEEIAAFLQNKQARLTLLFADCCNHAVSIPVVTRSMNAKNKIVHKGGAKRMKEAYSKLFLQAHGLLVVASAKAGEYSYTNNQEGSLYTIALMKGIKQILKQPLEKINWKTLIHVSKKKLAIMTRESGVTQHPFDHFAIIEN